ncbi:MAG: small multi-drug export protein [Oscillospiraceae bacterium]
MDLIEILKQSKYGEMLITFVVSMVPVLELRGAIPLGVSMGLSHMAAMLVSILGNMVPVPFIILFIRRIFEWLSQRSDKLRRLVERLEVRAEGKWDKVHRYQFFGLLVLVAIPLPGTGAWTGALIAALMNMRLKNAMLSIFLGVIVAGVLVTGLTFGFTSLIS